MLAIYCYWILIVSSSLIWSKDIMIDQDNLKGILIDQ